MAAAYHPSCKRVRPEPTRASHDDHVRIRTHAPGADAWRKRVDVYLRTHCEPKVVGVEGES